MSRHWTGYAVLAGAALAAACEQAGAPGPRSSPPSVMQHELLAQTGTPIDQILVVNTVLALNDPPAAAEELPGLGQKFQLFDAMIEDQDPDNSTNDVISVVATPPAVLGQLGDIGIAFRNFPPGIRIEALDDQINLKYFFVAPRTCGGGSPRITLLVDANGDGKFDQSTGDFAAQGHVNPPTNTGCVPNQWHIEDLTDQMPRWETTPLTAMVPFTCGPIGGAGVCTWDQLELSVATSFPNHRILAGFLLDGESCSFSIVPTVFCGKAFYDLVTLENRTLENRQDAVKK